MKVRSRRVPLPPELRRRMKAELRPLAAKRADRIGKARQEAEADYRAEREAIFAKYEAKVAAA